MRDELPHPLEFDVLRAIEARFYEKVAEGLREDGREIRALPAFVAPPRAGLSGDALVLDTGGTNMRAALVSFTSAGAVSIKGPIGLTLKEADAPNMTSEQFFGLHAELAEKLAVSPGLPLGYCFSYPFEALPSGDARLIRWTKGLSVSGVEGEFVGNALSDALAARGLRPRSVTVLNDTVAALLGGAARAANTSKRHIGLIVGTGTNMASFFAPSEAPKLTALGARAMAVNLESGNFNPGGLTAFDEELVREFEPRGTQALEKAVSGLYLPELYARARPSEADWAHEHGAKGLVARAEEAADPGSELARGLLLRSAQLVAAGLSAVARTHQDRGPMHVLAEGSLFWGWAHYRPEVDRWLQALCPEIPFEISRMQNANLIGAAYAALARR